MIYPEEFTAEDIMQFEYDFARWIDEINESGQYWRINAELQELCHE